MGFARCVKGPAMLIEDFRLKAPKSLRKNIAFREWLLRKSVGDKGFQWAVVERCKRDIIFYIDSFVYQFNPTKRGSEAAGPFIIWPFQAESLVARPETHNKQGFIWCFENNRSAVLEKSREMGATWIFLILQDWLCLFHDNVQTMNISHNAEAVDCKKKDSLFAKIRFMHRHLPDWLKGDVDETEFYFGYQRTDSEITGYASTGRAGVGGRAGIIFIDEVSKIREAREVRHHTASTAYCRFFNSTHDGTGTEFYKLSRDASFVQWQWHWTVHPEKKVGQYWYNPQIRQVEHITKDYSFPADYKYVTDGTPKGGPHPGIRSPWYDRKVEEIGSELGAAIELDINPEGSVEQFFDVVVLRQLIAEGCRKPDFEGDLEYDEENARPIRLSKRVGGPLRLWCPIGPNDKPVAGRCFIGGDISAGHGATPTCIPVFDATHQCKVAQYTDSFIDPIRAGMVMVALGWLFSDERGFGARLIWELIGPGYKAGEKIMDLGYTNVYFRTDEISIDKKISKIPGWVPTAANKERVLRDYREALRTRDYLNPDEASLRECYQFRYKNGKIVHDREETEIDSGARESHGDHVIADALAWKIAKLSGTEKKEKKKEVEPNLIFSMEGRAKFREMMKHKEYVLDGAWWRV